MIYKAAYYNDSSAYGFREEAAFPAQFQHAVPSVQGALHESMPEQEYALQHGACVIDRAQCGLSKTLGLRVGLYTLPRRRGWPLPHALPWVLPTWALAFGVALLFMSYFAEGAGGKFFEGNRRWSLILVR